MAAEASTASPAATGASSNVPLSAPARARMRAMKGALRWLVQDVFCATVDICKQYQAHQASAAEHKSSPSTGDVPSTEESTPISAGDNADAPTTPADAADAADISVAADVEEKGEVEAKSSAPAGTDETKSGDGSNSGSGAGGVSSEEAFKKQRVEDYVRESCGYPRLRAAFYHLPPPLVPEDADAMMAALKPLTDLISRADPDVKDLFFTVLQQAIIGIVDMPPVAPDAQPSDEAAPVTGADVANHLERVTTAKRMFEVREALKGLQYKKRGMALQSIASLTEARAQEMERQTAALAAAQQTFRKTKASAQKDLGECNAEMKQHVQEMEVRVESATNTMDARLSEHDKHLDMIRSADKATTVLVAAQAAMLKHRVCGLFLIDKLQLRRTIYTLLAIIVIAVGVYALTKL